MTDTRPIRKEACTLIKSLANPKKTLRIGNWNVRTLYSVGKTAQVVKEMQRYNLDVLGIRECRWSGSGQLKTQTGETILRPNFPQRKKDLMMMMRLKKLIAVK